MASRTDAALEGFDASANSPNPQAMTVFLRFKWHGAGGSSGDFITVGHSSGWATGHIMQVTTAGNFQIGNASHSSTFGAVTQDVWYDAVLVNKGSAAGDLVGYFGPTGGAHTSQSTTGTSNTDTTYLYLGYHNATFFPNITLDDVRIWSAALTEAEIVIERARRRPSRTANLNRWLPMIYASAADNAKDRSGNGYNMTVQGSPTIADGAPVGWGAPIIVPQYESLGPVLSLPGVQDITATSARPKVTITF